MNATQIKGEEKVQQLPSSSLITEVWKEEKFIQK